MNTISPALQQEQENASTTPSSLIRLRPTLWLDLDGGVIIREHEEILLTAREVGALRILAHTMCTSRSYLRASVIAQQLDIANAFDPEHCIEQNICSIRRKLGEPPRHPRILKGRRGLGYRLCPEL